MVDTLIPPQVCVLPWARLHVTERLPVMQDDGCCEVRASPVSGKGTFATRDLPIGHRLFTELAFLCAKDHVPEPPATLASVTVRHNLFPACIRLAPTDTGGTLSGCCWETYSFARAYLSSTALVRASVLSLAASGGQDTHAMVDLVKAEIRLLRSFDSDLRSLPASELEGAVHRYWANCMGPEGSLYERGSRLNHSCAANCSRVTLDSGGGAVKRAFVTLSPVAAGEELTLSYLSSRIEIMGTVIRRRHLWSSRGFLCSCTRCSQPQDDARQVACPDCSGRRGASGSGPPAVRLDRADGSGGGGEGTQRKPEEGEGVAFADWWEQSGMWVCRSCGWCSRLREDDDEVAEPASDGLHHEESVLSAEVFRLVVADAAVASERPAPDARCSSGGEAACEESGYTGGSDANLQQQDSSGVRQAKRYAAKKMLETSTTLLGMRHWVTFACAHTRLKQELSALLSDDRGCRQSPPATPLASFHVASPSRSSSAPPLLPLPSTDFLDWAMRELAGLWQWLGAALGSATSNPPAYYLFDVVCDLLDATRGCHRSGADGCLEAMLGRIDEWVSVFGDEEQRRRFTAVVKTV